MKKRTLFITIGAVVLVAALVIVLANILSPTSQEHDDLTPPPEETIVVNGETWHFLERITTNLHHTNTSERVYKYVRQEMVLADPEDATKGLQTRFTFDVYVKGGS